jgi:hypothetical protein
VGAEDGLAAGALGSSAIVPSHLAAVPWRIRSRAVPGFGGAAGDAGLIRSGWGGVDAAGDAGDAGAAGGAMASAGIIT